MAPPSWARLPPRRLHFATCPRTSSHGTACNGSHNCLQTASGSGAYSSGKARGSCLEDRLRDVARTLHDLSGHLTRAAPKQAIRQAEARRRCDRQAWIPGSLLGAQGAARDAGPTAFRRRTDRTLVADAARHERFQNARTGDLRPAFQRPSRTAHWGRDHPSGRSAVRLRCGAARLERRNRCPHRRG